MPRILDSNRSYRIKKARKPLARKAVYSAEKDAEFQTKVEGEIFSEWFGDDYGKTAAAGGERGEDEVADDSEESPAKRARISLESHLAIAQPKQVAATDELVDTMEGYVFDMQEVFESLGLSSKRPDIPESVAAALTNPFTPKSDKRIKLPNLPEADVNEVLARMKANQIMRDMTAWYDRLRETAQEEEESAVQDDDSIDASLAREVEPNLGDIYDLSKISNEVALLQAFNMSTLFAYHCIDVMKQTKMESDEFFRLLEPADVLAKHCALKLWKNNWHLTIDWERYLRELRADLADAKEWFKKADYLQRTIEFISQI
ncbi:hypothetical protein BKA67DRAFT_665096 [Truncatella angustata]|uniref:Uncharacterized protein n=1 Tax=Truncatella angustata TaxID=152316 RepID=A0A9P8UAW1_9PEZI|nr:uncharacterized protein BKA67DRAFT_665096 [Truncatella angustata]KAH6643275.1 hypothetical protein BKA67DRAFT_665096 [Truncatella angustata]